MVIRRDAPTDAWIIIAIHSTRLGPAAGGTRMKSYLDVPAALQDALRLAEGMTYKMAAAELPRGGGKAVIALPPDFDTAARPSLLRRYGELIHQLGGTYHTGPDVGTSSEDMDLIAETGAPYVHARTASRGGSGSSGPATALGVYSGIQATWEWISAQTSLAGVRVLVQGAGTVGGPLMDRLLEAGAQVSFSDVEETVVRRYRDERGLTFVPPEQVYETECDIFAPCALGGVLNRETIPRLKCRAVAGSANNQLAEPEDAERLWARGILYAPDFVVNAGGAIALTGLEALGWPETEAESRVKEIGPRLRRIYEMAAAQGITTEAAARKMAEARLEPGRMNQMPHVTVL